MYNFFYTHFILVSFFIVIFISSLFYELLLFFYKDIRYMEPDAVVLLLNANNAVVLDFRDKTTFLQKHILMSYNVNVTTDFSLLKKKYLKKYIIIVEDQTIDKRKLVKFLFNKGFSNIYFLKNGILNWVRCGFLLFTKKETTLKK